MLAGGARMQPTSRTSSIEQLEGFCFKTNPVHLAFDETLPISYEGHPRGDRCLSATKSAQWIPKTFWAVDRRSWFAERILPDWQDCVP